MTRRISCLRAALALFLTPLAVFPETAAEKTAPSEGVTAPAEPQKTAETAATEAKKAPPAEIVQKTQEEDVEELQVFKVTSSGDDGYIATHTLAGSRLNSELRETPAIIDVYTKQFMVDTGATTIDDLLVYSNNSLIDDGGNDGPDFNNPNGGSLRLGSSDRAISRGISSTRTRDYFDSVLVGSLYNVERVDDSRGPNSVLFGVGSAGGTINVTTKRARVNKSTNEAHIQARDHNGLYAAFDINRPIVKNTLAFRVNAMRDDRNGWRRFQGNIEQALAPTITYRPTKTTEIRVSHERGYLEGVGVRGNLPADEISRWLDTGATIDNTIATTINTTASAPLGISRNASSRVVWVEDQDLIFNTQNYRQSTPYPSDGTVVATSNQFNRPSIHPYDSNAMGPGARFFRENHNETVIVEQRLTRDLSIEVGYYHESVEALTYHPTTQPSIFGDPNAFLRNPTTVIPLGSFTPTISSNNTVNPNVGQMYVEGAWRRTHDDSKSTTYRATVAWQKDLGVFGSHRVALYQARQENENRAWFENEIWQGLISSGDPVAATNHVGRRNYFTPGLSETIYIPDPLAKKNLTVNYPGRPTPVTNVWAQSSNQDTPWSERTIDSTMVALQSHWWKRRIVTTTGYRWDRLEQLRIEPVRDASGVWAGTTGIWAFNETAFANAKADPSKTNRFTGKTFTAGAVFQPTSKFSVFANAARNIALPNYAHRIGPDGEDPDPPKGEGLDAGFTFSLLKEKLVGRVAYFDTQQLDRSATQSVSRVSDMADAVIAAITSNSSLTNTSIAGYSELRTDAKATADLRDTINSGVEARVTANLGRSWRLSLNYSYSEQTRETYALTYVMLDQLDAYIEAVQLANPSANITGLSTNLGQGGDFDTIGEAYNSSRTEVDNQTLDFESAYGNRPHKANMVLNYTFREGRLKGITTGVGVRYLSKPLIGRSFTLPGLPFRNNRTRYTSPVNPNPEEVYGNAILEYDFLLRYVLPAKFIPHVQNASIQLNIKNLLPEENAIFVSRYRSDGITPDSFGYNSRREITLSARIEF